MELSIGENDFLQCFENISSKKLNNKNNLNIFLLYSNANEFDYKLLERNLLDPIISYAISRKVKEDYKNKPGTLVNNAKEKFKNYEQNEGELGELMLYCFLETHLKAPKILSKMELKTSNNLYVNGSDGVHFLKLKNGNYQLIFGEAKMYKNLDYAVNNALKSIREFVIEKNKKEKDKSGITFEKVLISENLSKEFSKEDEEFLIKLVYPSSQNNFRVDDAFGIFIGYETIITKEEKKLDNDNFRKVIKQKVLNEISKISAKINKRIEDNNLDGHNFYIYIVPFTDIKRNKKEVLGEIIK